MESISFRCTIAYKRLFFLLLREAYHSPPLLLQAISACLYSLLAATVLGFSAMAKVHLDSNILKPFSGEGDVVAWLKKVRLVARLQHVDDVTSLLPLYLEGDALALYMEMKEEDQKDISLIKARLKKAFMDGAFTAYRKLTMVRWDGERVNVYVNKIRQLAGLAGFKGAGLERFTKLPFIRGFPNAISTELQQALKIETLAMGDLASVSQSIDNWGPKPECGAAVSLTPRWHRICC